MIYPTKKLEEIVNFKVVKNTKHLPFVGMEDIESGTGQFLGSLEPRRMKSTTSYFDSNSVLFGKLRPYLNKVFVPNFIGHCSTEFLPLRPNPKELTREWLALWLRSERTVDAISLQTRGARMPRASISFLKGLEIPVPPVGEQRKIVAKIEKQFAKIDAMIRLREDALAETEKILPAALHEIFSSAKSKGWQMAAVGDLCDIKGGKRLPKGHAFVASKTNHPYIRVADFVPYGIDEDNLKYISDETFKSISRYTIAKSDVFISIAGTIGSAGVVPENLHGANLTENAAKLTNLKGIDQRYLMYMLTSEDAKLQMTDDLIQTTIAKLGLFRIARLKIPLPPLVEQKAIIKKLDALAEKVRTLRDLQSNQLADLKALKQSILHEAFNGPVK